MSRNVFEKHRARIARDTLRMPDPIAAVMGGMDKETAQKLVERRYRIELGERIRTWGGWYRHDRVMLDGVCIGRIQVRRRNGRIDALTADTGSACVIGSDPEWLIRRHRAALS